MCRKLVNILCTVQCCAVFCVLGWKTYKSYTCSLFARWYLSLQVKSQWNVMWASRESRGLNSRFSCWIERFVPLLTYWLSELVKGIWGEKVHSKFIIPFKNFVAIQQEWMKRESVERVREFLTKKMERRLGVWHGVNSNRISLHGLLTEEHPVYKGARNWKRLPSRNSCQNRGEKLFRIWDGWMEAKPRKAFQERRFSFLLCALQCLGNFLRSSTAISSWI